MAFGINSAEVLLLLQAKDEVSKVLKSVSSEMGRTEGSSKKAIPVLEGVGNVLSSIGKVAAVAAVAGITTLTAALGVSVGAAADFEQRMSSVKAVSGATGEEMGQLSALALKLGKDTSFSASEAAKGIEELVKGGVSVADIMGGAALASLNLAAAGEIDLATAAEIAANAMNQFGLKGTDMEHVSDLIAGAANASSLSVKDFALSLQQVGAVANVAGQTFDSTAEAIAVLGAAGIKSSDAGTSLKAMLLNLQPATKSAQKAFAELGLTTASGANAFFDATGKAKSMRDISEALQTATANLTEQQKLAKLEIMFGSDAMRAAAILAKAGGEGFDTMAASMAKVTAQGVAAEKLNNVKGSIEQLKGSLETASIMLGMVFLPHIKGALDGVTGFVNEGVIPFIERHGPRLEALLGKASDAINDLGQTFSRILKPLLEAQEGTDGVVGAFTHLKTVATVVWSVIEDVIAEAVSFFGPKIEEAIAAVQAFGDSLEPRLSQVIQAFTNFWEDHWDTILSVVRAVFTVIEGIVQVGWSIISGIIQIGLDVLTGDWDAAWSHLGGMLQGIWEGILKIVVGGIHALSTVADAMNSMGEQIGAALTEGIKVGIASLWGSVTGFLGGMLGNLLGSAKEEIDAHSPSRLWAEEIGEPISEGIAEGITDGAEALQASVESVLGAAIGLAVIQAQDAKEAYDVWLVSMREHIALHDDTQQALSEVAAQFMLLGMNAKDAEKATADLYSSMIKDAEAATKKLEKELEKQTEKAKKEYDAQVKELNELANAHFEAGRQAEYMGAMQRAASDSYMADLDAQIDKIEQARLTEEARAAALHQSIEDRIADQRASRDAEQESEQARTIARITDINPELKRIRDLAASNPYREFTGQGTVSRDDIFDAILSAADGIGTSGFLNGPGRGLGEDAQRVFLAGQEAFNRLLFELSDEFGFTMQEIRDFAIAQAARERREEGGDNGDDDGFASGGFVPGTLGAPMRTTVHGGELILNPEQQAAAFGGTTVVLQFNAPVFGMDDFEAQVAAGWQRVFRRGGFPYVATK